jgi:hypothetical protein
VSLIFAVELHPHGYQRPYYRHSSAYSACQCKLLVPQALQHRVAATHCSRCVMFAAWSSVALRLRPPQARSACASGVPDLSATRQQCLACFQLHSRVVAAAAAGEQPYGGLVDMRSVHS